jgi:hypothetical protein
LNFSDALLLHVSLVIAKTGKCSLFTYWFYCHLFWPKQENWSDTYRLLINSSSQSDDLRGVILFGKLYLHLDKIGLVLLYNE